MKLLFFFVGISCIASSIQKPQLTLNLYYEGLCPDCYDFIVNQLYPAYQKLGDVFEVDLIPYGKAIFTLNYNGTVTFQCQHGSRECLMNKIHACVIHQKPEQNQLISFVYCDIKGGKETLTLAQECAEQNGISWDDVDKCISSVDSDYLLVDYGVKEAALKPTLTSVPHIRFNDVYDQEVENQAIENLLETVCGLLKGEKPSVCNEYI